MSHTSKSRRFAPWMILAAIISVAVLALTTSFDSQPNADGGTFPAITLGLTAEAREALQQSGDAFPANDAGFSAYYRVGDGLGGFGLDKDAVDQVLFNSPDPTARRAGVGNLLDLGGDHTVASIPIKNIDSLITNVNVYYDNAGWIVAYLARGSASSQVWQAVDLNTENPELTDISRTTLLDAINDVMVEALNSSPLTHDQLGYYHWEYPTATDFLMIATAREDIGSKFVSFAVPSSFIMQEVSVSMWISETDTPCARVFLDDVNITGDLCNRNFQHVLPSLSTFNSRSAHTLQLDHYNEDKGASGALIMLVYSPQ